MMMHAFASASASTTPMLLKEFYGADKNNSNNNENNINTSLPDSTPLQTDLVVLGTAQDLHNIMLPGYTDMHDAMDLALSCLRRRGDTSYLKTWILLSKSGSTLYWNHIHALERNVRIVKSALHTVISRRSMRIICMLLRYGMPRKLLTRILHRRPEVDTALRSVAVSIIQRTWRMRRMRRRSSTQV